LRAYVERCVLPQTTFSGLPKGEQYHIHLNVDRSPTESDMDRRRQLVNSVLTTMNTTTTRSAGNVMK